MKHIIKPGAKILIVCCQHGNERFGLDVFNRFMDDDRVSLLLANEEAIAKDVRFIDTDLNRSFPGDPKGSHEERLAYEIKKILPNYDAVLDIHTTTSDLEIVPILLYDFRTKQTNSILTTINKPCVLLPYEMAEHSLIANSYYGVSLEFGAKYAEEQNETCLKLIENTISNLQRDFQFSTVMPPNIEEYGAVGKLYAQCQKNFEEVGTYNGKKLYSFLVGEKEYKDHNGFLIEKVIRR